MLHAGAPRVSTQRQAAPAARRKGGVGGGEVNISHTTPVHPMKRLMAERTAEGLEVERLELLRQRQRGAGGAARLGRDLHRAECVRHLNLHLQSRPHRYSMHSRLLL